MAPSRAFVLLAVAALSATAAQDRPRLAVLYTGAPCRSLDHEEDLPSVFANNVEVAVEPLARRYGVDAASNVDYYGVFNNLSSSPQLHDCARQIANLTQWRWLRFSDDFISMATRASGLLRATNPGDLRRSYALGDLFGWVQREDAQNLTSPSLHCRRRFR